MKEIKEDFGVVFQFSLIEFLISDPTSFSRCRNILKPEYFENNLGHVVEFILQYSDEHNAIPIPEQIAMANGGLEFKIIPNPQERDTWLLEKTEKFCRYRAIENVILQGTTLLQDGAYGEIERQIKDAMTISLITDLGDDYFMTTQDRMSRLKNRDNMVSTGWKSIDKKLYGGYTKGSLNIFAGGSGSGKSLFLQNQALIWSMMGLNVIYITLELSQDLVGSRIDSMVTGLSTKDIFRDTDGVCFKINQIRQNQKPGSFLLKKMPEAGTTCNDIKAYLKEYQIKTGIRPDAVLIDYLDLVYPNNAKIDVTNLFSKDKFVAEEMRAIAGEWDIPVITASQMNRGSIEASEFDHSHIAGGISKINTADNVFGIFTSESMRESGKYRLQFLKTRSSSAVGSKIDLAYDPDCMRITDMADFNEMDDDEPNDVEEVEKEPEMKRELDDLFAKMRR